MNASVAQIATSPVAAQAASNVIAVDFKAASAPQSEFAKRLAAEAEAKFAGLANARKGGIQGLSDKRQDVYTLNPYLIGVMPGFNSRDFSDPSNQEHVDTIARSIAEIGFLRDKPITVVFEDGRPYVTDGECRLRATLRAIEVYGAEVLTVPVIVERYASKAEMIANQITRNGSKPFSVFERADNYKKLLGLGWDEAQIAKRFGLSTVRVQQILTLGAVGKDIRALVNGGKVSADFVLNRLTANGGDEAKTLADLTSAIENAAAKGKTRASAKHLTGAVLRRPSGEKVRKELHDLLKGAKEINDRAEDVVVVTFFADDFARLRELLGL